MANIIEHKIKLTGDISDLARKVKEAKGDLQKVANNEYIVSLQFGGNINNYNKTIKNIFKELPKELQIELQYNLNKKALKDINKSIDDLTVKKNIASFFYDDNFEDINKDLELINTNIKALHILTKYMVREMENKETDTYILNVASAAAFQPGPLMSTYYATKSYVYQLTEALYYEEKVKKTKVHVSVLCPGPVDTNFNNVANVKFSVKPLKSTYVAKYAIDKCFLLNQSIQKVESELSSLDQLDLFYDIEVKLALVLAKMECNGFKVDKNRLENIKVDRTVFDNSWDIYFQDIPSEKYFINNGITEILVISRNLSKDFKEIFKQFSEQKISVYLRDGYSKPKCVKKAKKKERDKE